MKTRIAFFLFIFSFLLIKSSGADFVLPFKGRIDFTTRQLDLSLDLKSRGLITAKAVRTSDKNYHLFLDIDHLQTPGFDVSSKLESSLELINDEQGRYKTVLGKIWSQYSLVDYRPAQELSGEFEIKNQKLLLNSLSLGHLQCQGYVDLVYPHKVDLLLGLDFMDLTDFLAFWSQGAADHSAGSVSGEIKISGALDRLQLKGNLESFDGFVQELAFNSFYLNFTGVYPVIEVANSTVSKSDGMIFTVDGALDLNDPQNFRKQIQAFSILPIVKDSRGQKEWTIKRLRDGRSSTTELKYLLKKESPLGPSDPSSDLLGVQRTVEF